MTVGNRLPSLHDSEAVRLTMCRGKRGVENVLLFVYNVCCSFEALVAVMAGGNVLPRCKRVPGIKLQGGSIFTHRDLRAFGQ